MCNVLFIGDTHLKSNSPISRKDDYPRVILNKLRYLAKNADIYNCKTFLILGDVFDSPTVPLSYLSEVINTFKEIRDRGIEVYSIVGNHDIKNNRLDSLPSTALGILFATDCVKIAPKEFVIDNTIFRCYNYTEEVLPKATNNYEVCIAHLYYDFSGVKDSLYEDDLKRLNYDAMVLGHLHTPCETITVHNTELFRVGSLSRNTSEVFNKVRTPRALLFNCKTHNTMYIDVMCESAENVFVQQTNKKNEVTFSMKELIQFMTSSYLQSDMDVREYFNKLQLPYECKTKIVKYLDKAGV